MTDQPASHRAEANLFLTSAERDLGELEVDNEVIARALIGIGHWLGAILDELLASPPERRVTVNAPNYVGSHDDLRKTLQDMARRGDMNAVLRRNPLDYAHLADHVDIPTDEPDE